MWKYTPPDYLSHYGVAGMRWGVRKAVTQPTLLGRARTYLDTENKISEYGILSRDKQLSDRDASRANRKIARKEAKGKPVSERLIQKKNLAERKSAVLKKLLSKNYRSLTDKQKKRGEATVKMILYNQNVRLASKNYTGYYQQQRGVSNLRENAYNR